MESNKFTVVSNHIGLNGEPVDRLYGSPFGNLRLIQADYTEYKGKITKKQLIKTGIDGNNFKSFCYVTDDGRWFDRGGISMLPPDDLDEEENEDDQREDSENTEERTETLSTPQDEESIQGQIETDPIVAGTEEK